MIASNSAKSAKVQPLGIEFSISDFSSLVNAEFQGQQIFGIDDIEFMSERKKYEYALTALFGDNWNPDNVGVFDGSNNNLYACSLARMSKGEYCDIIIYFGDFYDNEKTANFVELTTNDDGKFVIGNNLGVDITLVFITQQYRNESGAFDDVSVPYLKVSRTVVDEDSRYGVSYLVPLRLVDKKTPKARLEEIWLNGDIDELRGILATPFKGGGGWVVLQSIAYDFYQSGQEMPVLDIPIVGFNDPVKGDYGWVVDCHIDPDFQIPFVYSKPSNKTGQQFGTRNPRILRLQAGKSKNDPVLYLIGLSKQDSETRQRVLSTGLYVRIAGFNKSNPEWIPPYSINKGRPRFTNIAFPDFEADYMEAIAGSAPSPSIASAGQQEVVPPNRRVAPKKSAAIVEGSDSPF